jgi:hypothetical protein
VCLFLCLFVPLFVSFFGRLLDNFHLFGPL